MLGVNSPTGQVTSLIGPNGAGKSTLLMMMARLIEPDKGEIHHHEQSRFSSSIWTNE
jgi:iron complex transport system ATP-binding protein